MNYFSGSNLNLPYAAGCLVAYAWQNETIKENYQFKRFIIMREPVEEVAKSLEDPYLVAFTCYIWNIEYNKALAKAIKKYHVNCKILFGGRQIQLKSDFLFVECPEIDYLACGEGETAFSELLLALLGEWSLAKIPGLSFRIEDGTIQMREPNSCMITTGPSPYLAGVFDRLFDEYPHNFTAVLETNRGCPFQCAFCDWGSNINDIQLFPIERIKAEIDWIALKKIAIVVCADANLGITKRDELIIDLLIKSKVQSGWPRKLFATYSKNSDDRMFRIQKKLFSNDMSFGVTLSFQSINPKVLNIISRKNLTLEKFRALMRKYDEAKMPTSSDLILGLPGESYETFKAGVGDLMEAGQHFSLYMYLCDVLPNSRLSDPAFVKAHGIKTVVTSVRHNYYEAVDSDNTVAEKQHIICETNSMTPSDWKRMNVFAVIVQALHCLGPTRLLAVTIFREKKIRYDLFYEGIIEWAHDNPYAFLGELVHDIESRYQSVLDGRGDRSYVNPLFGNTIWPMEDGIFLEVSHQLDRFYTELLEFFCRFDLPEKMLEEMFLYQKSMVKQPNKPSVSIDFSYDFPEYFSSIILGNNNISLNKKPTKVIFPECDDSHSWSEYATKNLQFGRRGMNTLLSHVEIIY